jgi:CRP/FNR family transcriptional regulator
MYATAAVSTSNTATRPGPVGLGRDTRQAAQRIADSLKLVHDSVAVTRRVLHAGESVYESGERFESLFIVKRRP